MARFSRLDHRALLRVSGAEARPFLNRLLTQEVETLGPGELRYGALLTPQGRLLYDLFLFGEADGVVLDVAAAGRDALALKLNLYRLRAAVVVAPVDAPVLALWDADADAAPPGWRRDPRAPAAGYRAYGEAAPPPGAARADAHAYRAHRIALGLTDAAEDGLSDKAYATEANLDLAHGVDFAKGCFVGQETTSRMKRRGGVRSRVLPLRAAAAAAGEPVMAGTLRAGDVVTPGEPLSLALLRLDRLGAEALTVGGAPATLAPPPGWTEAASPQMETTP